MKPKSIFYSSVLLLLSVFLPAGGGYSAEHSFAPLNPEFVRYMQEVKPVPSGKQTPEGYGLGYRPHTLDLSHLTGQQLPAKQLSSKNTGDVLYDLRTLSRLTPVKNQGSHGTCWAFASLGSLESWILSDESVTWDFSENNLANLHGFDWGYDEGGNHQIAAAYLARWGGPVKEEDDPYEPYSNTRIGASTGDEPLQKHVQQIIYMPARSGPLDNYNIKYGVVTYGAVKTSMNINTSLYFNSQYNSYYYNGSESSNHAVLIVGWDDNFDKAKFKTEPPGNGAFIVRNSWGSSWGENGYFYISYYDTVAGKSVAVFNNAEPVDNYSKIYQYDPLGWVSSIGYGGETGWFCNIFTAQSNEQVKAVGLFSASINTEYEIYIYTDVAPGQPRSGTLALSQAGIISYPGYNTVKLNSPVPVTGGQKFSVVVKQRTPGYNYPVPLERPLIGYSGNATANLGESYAGSNGTSWTDIASTNPNTNVCIKAFTSPLQGDIPIISVTPTSLDFGISDTIKIFSITNTGGGSLTWSIGTVEYFQGTGWVTSVLPNSGTTGTETDTVTVTVSRAGLVPGTYTAKIPVTSNGGSKNVMISMTVEAQILDPVLTVVPTSLDFGTSDTIKTFNITNTGGGSLTWSIGTVEYFQGTGWVTSVLPDSGTTGTETDTVTVTVSRTGLLPGTYTAKIPVTSNGGSKNVLVSLTVAEPAVPPATPAHVSPLDGAVDLSLTPLLMASAYSHPEGAGHINSQWQVSRDAGFTSLAWDSGLSYPATTQATVPPGRLSSYTTYYWRVRYRSNPWSEWSLPWSFTTGTMTAAPRNEGQIVYVENISRQASGTRYGEPFATAGDILVQDIATGQEFKAVTNGAGKVILNPSFTSDGAKVLFTAQDGAGGDRYAVYIADSQATVALASLTPLLSDSVYNLRYAALSLDSDAVSRGLLAYTRDIGADTGTHELWVYNFATKKRTLLVQDANRRLRHPVFLADNETVAYLGEKDGLQDIFSVNASTGVIVPLTENSSPSPAYGRISGNMRKDAGMENCLIYSKAVAETFN